MYHIAVLVEAGHELPRSSLLAALTSIWRETGLHVSILRGTESRTGVDALFDHTDRTVMPDDHLAFLSRFPIVINGRVSDISKRRISRNLISGPSEADGPVIVKTDRNYGGRPEYKLALKGGFLRRTSLKLRNRLPWTFRSYLNEYRIFDSPRKVPRAVWSNPNFVVERFLPERRDGQHCLRTWLFLGEQERMAIFRSNEPIVKGRNIVDREPLHEVPEDLREMRRDLGFDFGKFDFAVVDGRTVLYDANRTPVLGATTAAESRPWLRQLAEGLWNYLPRPVQRESR